MHDTFRVALNIYIYIYIIDLPTYLRDEAKDES